MFSDVNTQVSVSFNNGNNTLCHKLAQASVTSFHQVTIPPPRSCGSVGSVPCHVSVSTGHMGIPSPRASWDAGVGPHPSGMLSLPCLLSSLTYILQKWHYFHTLIKSMHLILTFNQKKALPSVKGKTQKERSRSRKCLPRVLSPCRSHTSCELSHTAVPALWFQECVSMLPGGTKTLRIYGGFRVYMQTALPPMLHG